jgi:hypothetical protein
MEGLLYLLGILWLALLVHEAIHVLHAKWRGIYLGFVFNLRRGEFGVMVRRNSKPDAVINASLAIMGGALVFVVFPTFMGLIPYMLGCYKDIVVIVKGFGMLGRSDG